MVSIICCTMRQDYMENVFNNYESQQYKHKELIIILNKDDMSLRRWKRRARHSSKVSVYQLPEQFTLGECLNYGVEQARYRYIAKFDDDDYYAPFYLARSMDVLKEKRVDVVGKRAVFMYFERDGILAIHSPKNENGFVTKGIKGATLVFKKRLWEKVKFANLSLGEDTVFINSCIEHNFKVYAADKYNYVCLRKSARDHHTWNSEDERLLDRSAIVCVTKDYKPIIGYYG